MQKASLKISALILCGLLIYNSLGYFLVLSVMRVAVRQQKWAQLSTIPEQQLTSFIFNKNSSDPRLKIVNKREITVDGKLYDIVRKYDNGKTITYFCVHDFKEQTLISKTRLYNSRAQQTPLQNKARLIIEKIITTGIFNSQADRIDIDSFQTYSLISTLFYSGPVISILLPPPQFFC